MKERVGGRQRSLSFLPVFSCLEIPLIAREALAQGRGPGGPRPPLSLAQTEARRAKKNFFRDRAPPLSQGLDDRPPPPYLKVCQSKFLAPCQFLYLGQSILSAQLVNVHFVCATLITPVCLFFLSNRNGSLVISV